jgi:hypothetical protein
MYAYVMMVGLDLIATLRTSVRVDVLCPLCVTMILANVNALLAALVDCVILVSVKPIVTITETATMERASAMTRGLVALVRLRIHARASLSVLVTELASYSRQMHSALNPVWPACARKIITATIAMPIFLVSVTALTTGFVIEARACATLALPVLIALKLWLALAIVPNTENACLELVTASRATRATTALANCLLVPTHATGLVNALTMYAYVLHNTRAKIVQFTMSLFHIVPTIAPAMVAATANALVMLDGLVMIARVAILHVRTSALVLAFVVKMVHVSA